MKLALTVLGVVLALTGTVFALQGVGILPGSYMSNNPQWVINGSVIIVVGAALVVFTNWPRKKTPPQ
jgi:hypothetical protein